MIAGKQKQKNCILPFALYFGFVREAITVDHMARSLRSSEDVLVPRSLVPAGSYVKTSVCLLEAQASSFRWVSLQRFPPINC